MMNYRFVLTVLAVASMWVMAGGCPSYAELGQPMTFRFVPANGGRPAIEADGDFKVDTAGRFQTFLDTSGISRSLPPSQRPTVFFTSGGGDLAAGLELGRIIRRYNLDTAVGAHAPIPAATQRFLEQRYHIPVVEGCPPSPFGQLPSSCKLDRDSGQHASYCVSACTIAFLGGVSRSMTAGSAYAVHQFGADCKTQPSPLCTDAAAAMAEAQRASAKISTYLEDMGIPQGFLTDMVLADPAHVTVLSNNEMIKYRVLYVPIARKWDVKGSAGGLVLIYQEQDGAANTTVEFACTPRSGSPELTLSIVGSHDNDRLNALSARIITFRFFPQNRPMQEFTLLSDEIVRSPYVAQGNDIGVIVRATSRIIDALRNTDRFQILASTTGAFNIQNLVVYANVAVDKDKVDGYITSCH
jgi:hypothetical protein